MVVALVRYPSEQPKRERLALDRSPRLLLVEATEPPPQIDDLLEDWIRVPAAEADVLARIATLTARAGAAAAAVPVLDGDGVLRLAGSWVSLPPVEARLAAALIDRLGAVVTRDKLSSSGWPDGAPGRNALDVHVLRLRRRLAPLGLVIRTVRSRGYLLEPEPGREATQAEA